MQASEVVTILDGYRQRRKPIAYDLEGTCNWITCYSIADSPYESVVIPFIHPDGSSVWEVDDEVAIWEATERLLNDPNVPKIAQNSLYDNFVLAWTYGILVRGLQDDTMVKHFEIACEMEKSLAFQVSIYTKEPFYKAERKHTSERVQLEYCAKDSMLTFECNEVIDRQLMPKQREHYRTNVKLLAPILYMELRGIRFDVDEAQRRLVATTKRIYALQDRINREAAASRAALAELFEALHEANRSDVVGSASSGKADARLVTILATAFCCANPAEQREVEEHYYEPQRWNGKKWVKASKRIAASDGATLEACCKQGWWQGNNAPTLQATEKGATWLKPGSKVVVKRCSVAITNLEDVRRFAKDSMVPHCKRATQLLRAVADRRMLPCQRGELATLLGLHVKINATNAGGDAQWFLYDVLGLPKQFIKEGNRLTDRLASDDEAVIKSWTKTKDRRAIWFLNLRRLLTSTKSLRAQPDADGRIRGEANLVGTETHRIANYGSPTGSSDLNLSTITKSHRDLYRADDGHWMVQRDLAGADGWTVAAYAAMLGDRTMLEDYLAGLKPAQIICLMLDRGVGVNKLSRDELRPLCKPITESKDWRYFPMKRGQHGWTYLMGDKTTSDQILTDTFKKDGKPVFMEPRKLATIRDGCFFVRYPGIPLLHQWMARELKERGELRSSDGFVRKFYGRKEDAKTQREAMAHLPQYYTTRATVTALLRMWSDPKNRRSDGSLIAEPLHTQHDSLIYQFPKDALEWGKRKSVEWFDNKFLIAQTVLTIPASGSYGESWGNQQYNL